MQKLENEPLSKHTYYRIGGNADVLFIPQTSEDLVEISNYIQSHNKPFFILGAGSNILVSDSGFDGVVIKTTKLNNTLNQKSETTLELGASVHVSSLLRKACHEGWAGLEWFAGIPGSIGGVIAMNAGTHLGEAKDSLIEVTAFDMGEKNPWKTFQKSDLKFEYRKNCFLNSKQIIYSSIWQIKKDDATVVKKAIDETLLRRKTTQPLDYPSCGSVFKNPKEQGLRAWEVIDRLGLRGHKIGGAQISEKHPNFILNISSAKASDVYQLIQLVKEKALKDLKIQMHEEVRYLGDFAETSL